MIDRIQPPEMSLADQAEEWQARDLEYSESARRRLADVNAFAKDYTKNQPARAVGIAFGLGVFLGWLIKRR